MWLFDFFLSILQICYADLRISRSILVSPLDFEIMREKKESINTLWMKQNHL